MVGCTPVSRLMRPRLRVANGFSMHARLRLRLLSTLPNLPIFRALQSHDPASLAVIHSVSQRTFTYGNLVADVLRARDDLERKTSKTAGKLSGERVAFLAENSYDYVGMLVGNPYRKAR